MPEQAPSTNWQDALFDRNSKVFFVVFFLCLGLSMAATYYNIMVLKNFKTFTEENVPEATDVYYDVFDYITGLTGK